MAHKQNINFVKRLKYNKPNYFTNKKVLEVGSLYINGTIRTFFENCDYLGIDVGDGNAISESYAIAGKPFGDHLFASESSGVDLICQGQELDHPDGTYDVTASSECFEHNPYWKETLINMIRMTKSNGLVFFTCATTGREEHGTTRTGTAWASPLTVKLGWEYYKNLTDVDIKEEIDIDSYFSEYEFDYDLKACDLYFWGIRR